MELIKTIVNSMEFQTTLKLLLSTIVGGLIGFDRGKNGRDAGIKTHAMVCFGACLVACLDTLIGYESTRLSAAVLSGIGFLGAGVIIVDNRDSRVIGLTTAAAIWVAACLGICIGSNYTWIVIPGTLCFYLITHTFVKIKTKIDK